TDARRAADGRCVAADQETDRPAAPLHSTRMRDLRRGGIKVWELRSRRQAHTAQSPDGDRSRYAATIPSRADGNKRSRAYKKAANLTSPRGGAAVFVGRVYR